MNDGKLIFNSYIARELLVNYGCKIIDLKKNRNNNSTIFVFENNPNIREYINDIMNNSMKGDKKCLKENKRGMQT